MAKKKKAAAKKPQKKGGKGGKKLKTGTKVKNGDKKGGPPLNPFA